LNRAFLWHKGFAQLFYLNIKRIEFLTFTFVFNRYYRGTTTEQKSEGTGLGMAILKSLIEAHEGIITVESALKHGTKFTITLSLLK